MQKARKIALAAGALLVNVVGLVAAVTELIEARDWGLETRDP
jgi:hypothetical protein